MTPEERRREDEEVRSTGELVAPAMFPTAQPGRPCRVFYCRCSQPSFFLSHCSKSYRTIEWAVSISASTLRAGRKT
jgi:hypothetical protein